MKRKTGKALVLGLAAGALLFAAPFWVEKPYTAWTEKETSKLLSDSPWARPAEVELDFSSMRQDGFGGRGGMGGPGGADGPGEGRGGPPVGGGPGMGGPGLGGPRGGMGVPQLNAVVMWRSALPVRQAMYQAAKIQKNMASEQLAKQIEEEPAHYILAVTGLPAMGGPGMGRRPGQAAPPDGANRPQLSEEQREAMRAQMEARILENTRLVFGNDEVAPEKLETVNLDSGRVLVFFFPKTFAIDAKGKDIRFRSQMGPMKLSAKFKPKEMVFAARQ